MFYLEKEIQQVHQRTLSELRWSQGVFGHYEHDHVSEAKSEDVDDLRRPSQLHRRSEQLSLDADCFCPRLPSDVNTFLPAIYRCPVNVFTTKVVYPSD